ncbi:MAG TPA: hypothetical protein VGE76_18380 [Opitutaceae bacterium]
MTRATLVSGSISLLAIVGGVLWLARPAAPGTSQTGITLQPRPAVAPLPAVAPSPAVADTAPLAVLRNRLGPSPSPEEAMRALAEIAQANPALALDLAQALGQTEEEKAMWITDLARQWAARDPQQAWGWLQQQNATRIRDLATGTLPETIVGTIAKTQPTLLIGQLDALLVAGEGPLGISPVVAIHLGFDALAASGQLSLARATAERWAADPAQPAIGEAAFVSVAAALAQADATQAGAWLKNLPASTARDIALVEFPAQLAQQQSPRAALEWAEASLPASLRSQALQRTFSDWVESAPADAGDWLGGHLARAPASAETDRLISTLVNLGPAMKASPATALQWVALVSEPAARSALEERIALRWARQDRDAAVGYIVTHPTLSPARKQVLLQQAQSAQNLSSEG